MDHEAASRKWRERQSGFPLRCSSTPVGAFLQASDKMNLRSALGAKVSPPRGKGCSPWRWPRWPDCDCARQEVISQLSVQVPGT